MTRNKTVNRIELGDIPTVSGISPMIPVLIPERGYTLPPKTAPQSNLIT
ncbi:MAG: hypothetical protein F6J93_04240 [Oscillatoria sp. SIO1A7]|nr:hypothetical protein [Oscillatoria sp. SIO1A7]